MYINEYLSTALVYEQCEHFTCMCVCVCVCVCVDGHVLVLIEHELVYVWCVCAVSAHQRNTKMLRDAQWLTRSWMSAHHTALSMP